MIEMVSVYVWFKEPMSIDVEDALLQLVGKHGR